MWFIHPCPEWAGSKAEMAQQRSRVEESSRKRREQRDHQRGRGWGPNRAPKVTPLRPTQTHPEVCFTDLLASLKPIKLTGRMNHHTAWALFCTYTSIKKIFNFLKHGYPVASRRAQLSGPQHLEATSTCVNTTAHLSF